MEGMQAAAWEFLKSCDEGAIAECYTAIYGDWRDMMLAAEVLYFAAVLHLTAWGLILQEVEVFDEGNIFVHREM